MGDDIEIAQELLRTIVDFLENGQVADMAEAEVRGYFTMCKQIEIFHEKFRQKGFAMSLDLTTGAFSLTSAPSVSFKYNLSRIADRMYERFWSRSTPAALLAEATRTFTEDFGQKRFLECTEVLVSQKQAFNMAGALYLAEEKKYNLEATLFMEAYECIAHRPEGLCRVVDLTRELVIEDECAETVVAMFAIDNKENPVFYAQLKSIILSHLREKLKRQPHSRLWLRMLSSAALLTAVSIDESFLAFVLEVISSLSSHLTEVSPSGATPPNALTFDALVRIVNKFYRNKVTCQAMINFIFNQCAVRPVVWSAVLSSCHRTDVEPLEDSPFRLPITNS